MKSASKEAVTATAERRKSDRREAPVERREDPVRAGTGERRVAESRGMAEAMVDALDDILRWEKTSERTLKVAAKVINNDKPSN